MVTRTCCAHRPFAAADDQQTSICPGVGLRSHSQPFRCIGIETVAWCRRGRTGSHRCQRRLPKASQNLLQHLYSEHHRSTCRFSCRPLRNRSNTTGEFLNVGLGLRRLLPLMLSTNENWSPQAQRLGSRHHFRRKQSQEGLRHTEPHHAKAVLAPRRLRDPCPLPALCSVRTGNMILSARICRWQLHCRSVASLLLDHLACRRLPSSNRGWQLHLRQCHSLTAIR